MSYEPIKPILFIVEGQHEQDFLKKITNMNRCRKNSVYRLNNGKTVSTVAITNKIDGIVKRRYDHDPFIILFDREDRKESCSEIISSVKNELEKRNHEMNRFVIGVADKYLESWLLPFVAKNGEFPVKPSEGFDGKKCKGELMRRLNTKGIKYNKRRVGIDILLEIDPVNFEELAKFSESFKKFHKDISGKCKWISG